MASPGTDPRPSSQAETSAGREDQETTARAADAAADLGDAAKQKAAAYTDEARSTLGRLAEDAKARTRAAVEDRKEASAWDIADVARALLSSADDLERRDRVAAASYVRQAAGGLERFAGGLERRDLDDLVHQTEEFARRQPGLFVGGAVAAGFALARFLKSSAERRRADRLRDAQGPDRFPSGTAGAGATGASGPGAPERPLTPSQEGDGHVNR